MTGPTDNPCGSVDGKMRHHIWSFVSWSIRATSRSIGSTCACKSNSLWPKMQIDQFIQSQSVNRHTLACKQADKWCGSNVASRAKIIPNPLRRRRHRLRPSAPAQNLDKSMTASIRQDSGSVSHKMSMRWFSSSPTQQPWCCKNDRFSWNPNFRHLCSGRAGQLRGSFLKRGKRMAGA